MSPWVFCGGGGGYERSVEQVGRVLVGKFCDEEWKKNEGKN